MRLALTFLAALSVHLIVPEHAEAQFSCPSLQQCRQEPPGGKLIHARSRSGQMIWTTACGPNTYPTKSDLICNQIATCAEAGGFGKFLQAVSGSCSAKHFEGYFGLDGMTFGILDWTWHNFPGVLKAYQQRSSSSFTEKLGALNLPMKNGCVDATWTCNANKNADLMCKQSFRSAFTSALNTPEFRKAQMDYALWEYEKRLARFADLGLTTEYGNTAMAVIANNLVNSPRCRPHAWKAACVGKPDEKSLVDCMLERYAEGECRGSLRGSRSRLKEIKEVFAKAKPSGVIHPTASAVEQCVADWSK